MNYNQTNFLQKKDYIWLGLLGFIEFCVSVFITAIIPKDPGNLFIFGFSTGRVILLTVSLILALFFLIIAIFSIKNWRVINKLIVNRSKVFTIGFCSISFFIIVFGWFALFSPPLLFGKLAYYFERLRPIAMASGLMMVQFWVIIWIRLHNLKNYSSLPHQVNLKSKPFWVTFVSIFVFFIITYLTKFGLVLKTALWNVPGIPVSSLQLFFVVLCLIIFLLLAARTSWFSKLITNKTFLFILPVAIYIIAVLVWGLTPLDNHFFSLKPSAPNFQPYPYSDAREHDQGALSILYGNGIYFHGYTDKPLYMVLLAIFHLFAGYDYVLLEWIQILFLAAIPVIAYFLGNRFHSPVFGILVATFIILQQRNAIVLSKLIASVNVKLLVTEGVTLLGMVFLVILFFYWYKTKEKRYALLLGGIIGAVSLIRLNPLLFLPAIGLMIILFCWNSRRLLISQLMLFFLGFIIVFSPWLIFGTDSQGQPWFLRKINDVIHNRINPVVDQSITLRDPYPLNPANTLSSLQSQIDLISFPGESDRNQELGLSSLIPIDPIMNKVEEIGGIKNIDQYFILFTDHFFHNIVTSFMALPDSLTYQKIIPLSQREYWQDENEWNGNLPIIQLLLIAINLFVVSLGIVNGWQRHRWGGLIPGICFLLYDLALSFSLTSGGRYLVPINWIVFFYYGLGILSIINFFLIIFKIRKDLELPVRANKIDVNNRSHSIIPALIGLLILASLIPLSNLLLSNILAQKPVQTTAELMKASGVDQKPGDKYISGVVLYPYYGWGPIAFDFLHDQQIDKFEVPIDHVQIANIWLKSGETAIIELNSENQPQRIYSFQDGKLQVYWGLDM